MNPYVADILAQPAALHAAVRQTSMRALEDVRQRLQRGDLDRILVTGMGSSYNAAYPAVLELCRQPIPVQFVNTAELLYALQGMIGPRTLLWMNSQSGESAELVHLVEQWNARSAACSLAFTNNRTSALAQGADIAIPIHAGIEATVSTKTYVNMLAVNLLAATFLCGGDSELLALDLKRTADAMDSYLTSWQAHMKEIDDLLGGFQQLLILGRGPSMSAVWNGSLINKEAAKCAFEGMHAADFRHGPLELVSAGFVSLVFAGPSQTSGLNRGLALEIAERGGHAIWVDQAPDAVLPTLLIPQTSELARPLVEILPLQLLSLVMADHKGLQAGKFRHVSKVTVRE